MRNDATVAARATLANDTPWIEEMAPLAAGVVLPPTEGEDPADAPTPDSAVPSVLLASGVVLLLAIARAWKAAKVLAPVVGALMAPTMPC